MKKTISIIIAVMMIITAVPMFAGVAFAADGQASKKTEVVTDKTVSDNDQQDNDQQDNDQQDNDQQDNDQDDNDDQEEPEPEPVVAPGNVTLLSASCVSSYVKISWKQVECAGYEILVSTKTSFKSVKRITVNNSNTTTYYISGLKAGKNYYIKMRAFNISETGQKLYSDKYSNVKGISLKTGWRNKNGRMYYYIKGKPAKGSKRIKGLPYYFNSTGELKGATAKMWKKVRNRKSKTKKLISVDTKNNIFCVYYKTKKGWAVKKYWRCSTGKASTPTVKGVFKVTGKNPHFGENHGYTCWYATQFYGDYLIHSGTYYPYSKTRVMDNRMGVNISHGCVRLTLDRAKWIYKTIPKNTPVVIY